MFAVCLLHVCYVLATWSLRARCVFAICLLLCVFYVIVVRIPMGLLCVCCAFVVRVAVCLLCDCCVSAVCPSCVNLNLLCV